MKLILVEWIDSHAGRGWKDIEDIEGHCKHLFCHSVGWLVKETKDSVMIVPHISGEKDNPHQGSGDICLPKSCVKKITVLRKK